MKTLAHLFENNRRWADQLARQSPDLLPNLARGQTPPYMWIGCSDSRVPANELMGISAGEVFVYRNVANQIQPSDTGVIAALYYAVVVLKVRHVLICGHYSCGGVQAVLEKNTPGPLAAWLLRLQVMAEQFDGLLSAKATLDARTELLCELNVVEQIRTAATLPFIREAWKNGQALDLHGWMFRIGTGRLDHMNLCVRDAADANRLCDEAVTRLVGKNKED
jgi:carbonic anhydrase